MLKVFKHSDFFTFLFLMNDNETADLISPKPLICLKMKHKRL